MTPKKFAEFFKKAVLSNARVLVKGKPGIGKSDIVLRVASETDSDVVLMHPAISESVDFKGLPSMSLDGKSAHFLPFGQLNQLIEAPRRTICFLDDIGQACPSVQAALMQLILARSVNGTKISNHVVFAGATNDVGQMAGVSGIIEPLKSRWDSIVELEVSADDWSVWALEQNLPPELIAFIRFRPNLLSDFKPCKGISNSPSPRGWHSCAKWMLNGVKELEVFAGAVGEGAAVELWGFLDLFSALPSLDAILLDPQNSMVPEKPAQLFAVSTGLARKSTPNNFERVCTYIARLPKEFEVACVKDVARISKNCVQTPAFVKWATKNADVLL